MQTGAPCWKPDPPSTGTCQVVTASETPRLAGDDDAIARRRRSASRRRWEGLPYWLILPTLGYLAVFFAWPMVKAFELAFQDESGQLDVRRGPNDVPRPEFEHALTFTLLLVVVIVPLQFVLAFVMALIVNATLRGRGLFLFIFILPLAVSDLAAGIVWSAIFTEHGYLNTILQHLGRHRPAEHLARPDRLELAARRGRRWPRSGGRRRSS